MSHNPSTNFTVYKRLFRYLAGYWKWFSIAVVAMVVASLTTPLFALLTKPLIDKGFVEQDSYYTLMIPVAIVILFLIRGIANYINDYLTTYLSSHLVQKVRLEMYDKIMHLPVIYFKGSSSGKIASKVLNDANQITDAGFNVITVLAKDGVMVAGLLAVLFYLDWQLTLITFATLPVVSVLVKTVSRRLRKLTSLNQSYMGSMTQSLSETVDGIKEIKIYNAYEQEKGFFNRLTDAIRVNLVKQRSANSISTSTTQFIIAVALAMIIYFAGMRAQQGFTPGSFMAFLSSMIAMFDPIKRMTDISQSLQRGMAGAESVFNFLDLEVEEDKGALEINQFKHEIQFKNVSFRYPDSELDNLKNIQLIIPKGKVVALVGSSGSGKSTLANLIPRFYDVSEGNILLDNIDIKDLTLHNLRKHIAMVSQDVFLFDDTVANNVAYGDNSKDIENIEKALKAANAWEFVTQLPEGINTKIGENGSKLSGGQRQRLMIARAILKNTPILILDEATSALDVESEKEVQNALERLMQDRTTVVIAHRLSTIESADLIVVMHEGRIVEQGKHHELLKSGGRYQALYNMQFS
ncbi:lipid A export permease/ATP-binding protein MsbA [Neisseriaceae bacterium PsAf]|nr:lipid A export permease/ATP-binding protein MsbA [Neisseriaceae bacterium PsAf]MCV2503020.1 lipid A export permease/ATP-binding protein MsbA [Neisseriaceae bacterium]